MRLGTLARLCLLLLLAPGLGRAVVVGLNGIGDDQITTHTLPLKHRRMVSGEDSKSYYLYFDDVPGVSDSSTRIKVSRSEFDAAKQGAPYALTTGAGNLGVPWLVKLKPAQ